MLGSRAVASLMSTRAAHRITMGASRTMVRASRAGRGRRKRLAGAPPLQRKHTVPNIPQHKHPARKIPRIDQLRSSGEVLDAHHEHRDRYQPLELSLSWMALGQILGHDPFEQQLLRRHPTLLDPLMADTLQAAPAFNGANLSSAVLGMAQLQHVADNALWRPAAALWSALAARGVEIVAECTPHELVVTAAAFAKARTPAPELHQALAAEATWRLGEFSPQQIVAMVRAHASAGHAAPGLLDAVAKQAARRVRVFTPRELANLAWAFATVERAAPTLLDTVAAEAAGCAGHFRPRDLANLAWGLARAGHTAEPALVGLMAEETSRLADELAPQEVAALRWAFARTGHTSALLQLPGMEHAQHAAKPELTNPLEHRVVALEDGPRERDAPLGVSHSLAARGDAGVERASGLASWPARMLKWFGLHY